MCEPRMANCDRKLVTVPVLKLIAEKGFPRSPKMLVFLIKTLSPLLKYWRESHTFPCLMFADYMTIYHTAAYIEWLPLIGYNAQA